jgi:peptidoglycan/xylan/chitin deacetylase (PgdA/CDA1 family)
VARQVYRITPETQSTSSPKEQADCVRVVCSAESAGNRIALTFDDGPHMQYTPQILDALAPHDARATFFVRGGGLTSSTREVVTRARDGGHEIGNHTQDHCGLKGATPEKVRAEVSETHELLTELLEAPPRLIRPPYGRGITEVNAFASTLDYRATILWNISPCDYDRPSAEEIARRVMDGESPDHDEISEHCETARNSPLPGAIVLLHDGCAPEQKGHSRHGTVMAMRNLVPALQNRGFQLVTVSDLLAASQ